jgi:hypothetical protein
MVDRVAPRGSAELSTGGKLVQWPALGHARDRLEGKARCREVLPGE